MTVRILYVSHSFPLPDRPLSNVGGMQRVATSLYGTLQRRDDVEVVPLVLETSWRWTGVRTGPFLLRLLFQIPGHLRRRQFDAVVFSSMVTAAVAPLLRGTLRRSRTLAAAIPVGRDVTLPNPLYQRWVPRVLRSLDLVFPISRATADACVQRGADPRKVHVVPCGVELPVESGGRRRSARDELRALLRERGISLPDEALVLLSVGRHQERKGFHWFADRVMPRIRDRAIHLVAGSGPMTPIIRERISAHGLQDRVVLLGQVSEELLQTLYSASDLFVMPNVPVRGDIEGFGVVMLEAGIAGLPVIAADLEGIRDVIREGENGRLVAAGDADAFIQAIDAYRPTEVREVASARAREYVEDHFGWGAVADQYLRILRAAGLEAHP